MMPEHVTPDIWIRGGLLDAKHREAMGEAIWLYLFIHSRVRFDGDGAGITPDEQPYRHTDAVTVLGLSLRTVKYQFERLEDAGYIRLERHVNHGLIVSVSKYEAAASRAKARSRVQPTARRETGPSAISRQAECNPASSRVQFDVKPSAMDCTPYIKDARASNVTNDSNEQTKGTRARALTPQQELVNAYYVGLGRDPYHVGKEYSRHLPAAMELVAAERAPHDIEHCTAWMWSDDWRRSVGRAPSLQEVAGALPAWIEDGRPAKARRPTKPEKPSRFSRAMAGVEEGLDELFGRGPTRNDGPAYRQLPRELPG